MNRDKKIARRRAAMAAAVALACGTASLGATVQYWDGDGTGVTGGGDGIWDNTEARWSLDPTGGTYGAYTGGDAVFGGAGGYVYFPAALSANSLTFAADYTFLPPPSGTSPLLTINTGIVDTGANDVWLDPLLGGTAGLTKDGAGTLYLTRQSSYTGATTINAGRIALRNTAGGLPDATALTVAAGAVYEIGEPGMFYNDTIGSLAGAGNVVLAAAPSGWGIQTGSFLAAGGNSTSTTFSGTISGAGGRFRKAGTGTLTLSGTNTYTGFTDILGGTLSLTSGTAIHDASPVYFATTGTVALNLNGVNETLGGLARGSAAGASVNLGAANLTVGGANLNLQYDGVLTGSGRIIKVGSGSQQFLNSSPGFAGGFTVQSGILGFGADGALGAVPAVPTADYIVLDGSTLMARSLVGTLNSNRGITLGPGGGTIRPGATLTYGGIITGSGQLTKEWETLILAAEQTYTGGTVITEGMLQSTLATTSTAGRPLGTGPVSLTGASLALTPAAVGASANVSLAVADAAGATFAYGPGAALSLDKNAANASLTVTLGPTTPTGDVLTRLAGGTLVINRANGNSNLETVKVAGGVAMTNGIVSPSIVLADGSGTGDFAYSVAGDNSIQNFGYVANDINAAAATDVVNVTTAHSLTASRSVYALRVTGQTVDAQGHVLTVGVGSGAGGVILNGASIANGTLAFGAADAVIYAGTSTPSAINAAITGSNGLTKFGDGELQLGAAGSWSGGTRVAFGRLKLNASNVLPVGTNVTLYANAVLDLNGSSQSIGTLDGPFRAEVALGAGGVLTVGSGDSMFEGPITASGAGATLIKDGSGVLTLGRPVLFNGIGSAANGAQKLVVRGGGTVSVSAGNKLGAAPATPLADQITLDNGTLRFTSINADAFVNGAASTIAPGNNRGVVLGAGGGTIEVTNPLEIVLFGQTANIFSGAGDLTKTGPGFLRLLTGNTYTGKTRVLGGNVQFNGDSALGAAPASFVADQLFIDNGAVIQTNGVNHLAATRGITIGSGGGTLRASTGSFTFSGVIAGSGDVLLDGNNHTVFNAANTFTGDLVVNAGTNEFRVSNSAGAGDLMIDPKFTSILTKSQGADTVLPNAVTLGAGSPIEFRVDGGTGGRLVLNGKVSGPAGFTKTGNGLGLGTNPGVGALVLGNSTNDFAGAAVVQIGTLVAAANNALGATSGPTIVYPGGTLGFEGGINYAAAEPLYIAGTGQSAAGAIANTAGNNTFAGAVTLMDDATVASASGTTFTLTGAVRGRSPLTKAGAGTVRLAGSTPNTNADVTIVSAGTLELAKPAGVNAVAGSLTVNSGGTVLWLANEQVSNGATLTLNSGGTLNLNGFTESVGAFVDNGGTTVLGGGALNVTNDLELTDGTTISVATELAGGLIYTGTHTTASITGAVTLAGGGINHTFDINDGAAAVDTIISGGIGGSGHTITKTGAGTLQLSGSGSYSGGTTVAAGTLVAAHASALGTGAIVVENGAALQFNQSAATANITNNGNLTIASGATVSFSPSGNTFTHNDGALNVNGALTLNSHTFSYLGGTIAGTVTMSGSPTLQVGGGVTNGSNGTFLFDGFSGTVIGNAPSGMTLNVRPATGPHTFNIGSAFANNGTMTLSGASTHSVTLQAPPSGTFTNNGSFTINGGDSGTPLRTVNAVFINANGASTTVNNNADFGNIANNGSFTIASGATVTLNPGGNTVTQAAGTLAVNGALSLNSHTFTYNGGTVAGTVTMGGSATLNLNAGLPSTSGGTFLLNGFSGAITGNTTAAMTLNAHALNGPFTLNIPSPFANNGSMTLSGASTHSLTVQAPPSGTFTNNGSFIINGGASGTPQRTVNAVFVNASGATTNVNTAATFSNITNNGNFNIASGATVSLNPSGNTITQAAGTLDIDGALTLNSHTFTYSGGTVAGTVTMGGSATLNLTGTPGSGTFLMNGFSGAVTGNTPAAMTLNAHALTGPFTLNVPSPFTNNGSMTLSGASTHSLTVQAPPSGTFTNNGSLTINGGDTGTPQRTVNAVFVNASGATTNVNTTANFSNLTNNGSFTIASGATVTLNPSGNTVTQAAGTLAVNGALSLNSQTFTYNGGTVAGTVTMGGSGTLNLGGGLSGSSGGTFLFNGFSGAVSGNTTAAMMLNAHATIGPFTLNIPNPFTNNGSITLSGASTHSLTVQAPPSGTFTNVGTFTINGGDTGTPQRSINAAFVNATGATTNVNTTADFGNLTNAGSFNIANGAAVTINPSGNTFTHNAGTTAIAAGGSLTTPSGTFTFNGGTVSLASDAVTPGQLTLAGNIVTGTSSGVAIESTGNAAIPGTINLGGATRVFDVGDSPAAADDVVISARLTNGSINKLGLGTLVLSGANNHGVTSITAGTVRAVGGNALSNTAVVNFPASGGPTRRLEIYGGAETVGSTNAGSTNTAVYIDAGATLITGNPAASTFAGVIEGGGALIKGGTQQWSLAGTNANTLTGLVQVNAGTLRLAKPTGVNAIAGNVNVNGGATLLWAANEQIADTATLTLNSGGMIDLAGFTETIKTFVDNGGTTVLGGGTLNVTDGDLNLTDGTEIAVATNLSGRVVYTGTTTAATVSADLTLTGAKTHTFNIANGAAEPDVLISGAVLGGATEHVTKTGAGTVELSGGGSVGDVNVDAGLFKITGSSLATAKLALNDGNGAITGGTVTASGHVFVADGTTNAVTLDHSAGTLAMTGAGTVMIIGRGASSAGSYNLSGTGVLNMGARQFTIGGFGAGTMNQSGGTVTAGDVLIAPNGNTASYTLSGGTASTTGVYVGGSQSSAGGGTGVLNVGPGAALTASGTLKIWNAASNAVNFTGGTITAGTLDTGGNPSRFNWTGGTLTLTQPYSMTVESGGLFGGTFNVGAGKHLSNNGVIYVASSPSSTGTMNITGGGTVSTTADGSSFVIIGHGGSSNGTVLIDGAGSSWSVAGNSSGFVVGNSGTGTLTVANGGTFTTAGPLYAGYSNSSTGIINLSGSGSAITAPAAYVGGGDPSESFGAGDVNVSGGSLNVAGTLRIFNTPGTSIDFSGGTITAGALDTGGNPSRFNWTGGTLAVTGGGGLAIDSGGPLGASVSVDAARALNVTNALVVGAAGTLNLSGGTLTAGSLAGAGLINATGAFTVGGDNTSTTFAGTLAGAGGAMTKTGSGTLALAGASPNTSTGTTTVAGGTLTLAKPAGTNAIAGDVAVNNGGTLLWAASDQVADTATLTLNSGGTINLAGHNETIKSFVDNGGTTVLGGGTLNVTGGDIILSDGTTIATNVLADRDVVYTGTTTAATISGNVTFARGVTHNFDVADGASNPDLLVSGALAGGAGEHITKLGAGTVRFAGGGSVGNVNVNAGTLQITASSYSVGDVFVRNGAAVIQSGGTLTPSGHFQIANESGTTGTYTLTAGTINVVDTGIGAGGPGTFIQTGGVHNVAQNLILTNSPTGVGYYNLGGGTLATGSGIVMGGPGTATFTQTGGAAVVEGEVHVSNGLYTISDGSLQAKGKLIVGWPYPVPSTFTQSGGSVTLGPTHGHLEIGGAASGTYNLNGGTLAIAGELSLGYAGPGSFNQTGGTNTVSGTVAVAVTSGSAGSYSLGNSGILSAGAVSVGNAGSGTFTHTGGTLSTVGNLDLGVTVGSLGRYDISAGTVSAAAINIGGTSGASGGVGTMNVSGVASVTSTAATHVWPSGTLSVTGGTFSTGALSGSGAVNAGVPINVGGNNASTTFSGTIGGAGGITKAGTGTLTLAGATNNTLAGVTTINAGTVALNKSPGANALGGSVTVNSGGALQWGAANQLDDAAALTVGGGAAVNLAGHAETVTNLNVNAGASFTGGTITLAPVATTIANATADYSGTQGANNWQYGWYDGDAPTPYSNGDFEQFPTFSSSSWSINSNWWTIINPDSASHPNGHPSRGFPLPDYHWTARRWVSEVAGQVTISGSVSDLSVGQGDGVDARIIVDGVSHQVALIGDGGSNAYNITVPVNVGSLVDFVVGPRGDDAWDSTTFTANITTPTGGNLALGDGATMGSNVNLGGNLTYNGATSAAAVNGALTFTGSSPRSIDVANGSAATDLTIAGPLGGGGGTVTKTGAGALAITGAQSWSPGSTLTVNGGTVRLETNGGPNLAVAASAGDVTFTTTQQLAALTVGAGRTATMAAGAESVLDVSSLALAGSTGNWTGKLDLNENGMIVRHGGLAAATLGLLTNQVRSGLNVSSGNLWSGNGITSTAAALEPIGYTGIGLYSNEDGRFSTFGGFTLGPDAIVLAYTKLGDANLDGLLNIDDLAALEFSLDVPGASGWQNGDFNYDGVIDRDNDYAIWIDSYFAHDYELTPTISAAMARIEAMPVPEPTGAAVLCAAAASTMLGRRRRRRDREPDHAAATVGVHP